jgi:enoyl-CoA hydratase
MTVSVEKSGPITTVILSRPEVRNAVDRQTAAALATIFRDFDADETAKVAVLYGDHGVFCAGADLKARAAGQSLRVEPVGQADGPMGFSRLFLNKPVIAAVAGYAVAGGLELALWCDLRVAEEDAVFGVFCRRWGVPLLDGGTVRLPRLIGLSRALDMILTGRPVTAAEALQIGLVNRIVPPGTSRQAAEQLARDICRFPQLCLRGDRRSAYGQFGLQLEDALAYEYQCGQAALQAEAMQGARRFAAGAGRHGSFETLDAP